MLDDDLPQSWLTADDAISALRDGRDHGCSPRFNGGQRPVHLGSLNSSNDWSDAEDPVTDRSRQPLRGLRIVIVDDTALHRGTLANALRMHGALDLGAAWDLGSLGRACEQAQPNIVLLRIGTRESMTMLRATGEIAPGAKVIVLGLPNDDETQIVACAEVGVAGYHTRRESLADLLILIGRVADGETSFSPAFTATLLHRLAALASQRRSSARELVLTARENQILQMLELGLSNHDIAVQLSIAVHTVKNHVHSLLKKLGVATRADAAALARANRRRTE